MARERMVTRTVTGTKVNVLCLNVETAEPFNKEFILSGTFKDNSHALNAVTKLMADAYPEKPVDVVSMEVVETLYGMTEQKFIENAQILPARTIPTKKEH